MDTFAKNPDHIKAIARILGGVPIWGVLPGSAADRAGMRYGDIVMRVNGIETPNLAQFVRAQSSNGDRIEFEVVRHGIVIRLGIDLDQRVWS